MKHLKTFEELSPSTYLSAANKLGSEHPSRSSEIKDWAIKDVKDKVFTFMVSKSNSFNKSSAYCPDRSSALEFKKFAKDYLKRDLNINSLYKESYGDDFFKVDTKFDGQYFVPVASQRGITFNLKNSVSPDGAKMKIRVSRIFFDKAGTITAFYSSIRETRPSEESSEPVEKTPTKAPSRWQKFKDKLPSWKESYM
jgi:hypothetical protein